MGLYGGIRKEVDRLIKAFCFQNKLIIVKFKIKTFASKGKFLYKDCLLWQEAVSNFKALFR